MASAEKQVARNREIVIARARGEDVEVIAARHDLTPARVRQILAAGTAVLADGDGPDPVQVALQRRTEYEGIYENALALFERIPDSNPSPKVGALRLALGALDRLGAWDQSIGVLPREMPWVFVELDARRFIKALLQILEEEGVPDEAIDRIVQQLAPAEKDNGGLA